MRRFFILLGIIACLLPVFSIATADAHWYDWGQERDAAWSWARNQCGAGFWWHCSGGNAGVNLSYLGRFGDHSRSWDAWINETNLTGLSSRWRYCQMSTAHGVVYWGTCSG